MRSTPRRRWLGLLLQLLGSGLVIGLLLKHADPQRLRDALAMVDPFWLVLVIPIKALGVTLHELRLYLVLRAWGKPSLSRVLGIGYTAGLTNTVLPLRGGDVLAVALLRAECKVSTVAAVTAVGVASVLEVLVFGVVLLLLLLLQGATWASGVADLELSTLLRDVGLVTAVATMAVLAFVMVLRQIHRRATRGDGPDQGLLQRLADAGRGLGLRAMAINTLLAVVQVGFFLGSMLVMFRAMGLDVAPALLAACVLQAAGSLAATVLPQTMGAGQAASSVLVMATFGIGTAPALALAALMWASHQVVTLILGGVPLWRRLGKLAQLRREPQTGP